MVKTNKTGIDYNPGDKLWVWLKEDAQLVAIMEVVELLPDEVLTMRFVVKPPQVYQLEQTIDIEARYCFRDTNLYWTLFN